ncbi:hypothetical protein AB7179_05400 [Providencia manganoxydans]|uniref:hypothetical protein n=1 Tax=Providencia TaxID=586 RepID=UPI002885CC85|nr:hypothetical protein [Providencia stuartii]MDT1068333.1 hypothetical protein [Providencia stuartii]
MKKFALTMVGVMFLSGCTVNLPFNNRLAYTAMKEVKEENVNPKYEKISIDWEPSTFPSRIDVQGADGFVGGGSRTRIPTGVALSSRIEEALSAHVDVNKSGMPLLIKVLDARSGFEYSAGIFNITPTIDVGTVYFKAMFTIDGTSWENEFKSQVKDPTVGGTSQTGTLESAWDNVAIDVAKDIMKHIRK